MKFTCGGAVRPVMLAIWGAVLAACSGSNAPEVAAPTLASGLDIANFDHGVRPQDDLYRYINGKWLDTVEIPADKARYGAFQQLAETAEQQLREIVEGLEQNTQLTANSDEQKIRDLYASFMDEKHLDELGDTPLQTYLQRIDALQSAAEVWAYFGTAVQLGINIPITPYVHQDNRDATRYAVDLYQSGLGLPDRDYYLKDGDDGTYKKIREAYLEHITKMLTLAKVANATNTAGDVLKLETALAKEQWDKVTNRDPVKLYNKYSFDELSKLTKQLNWSAYLQATSIDGKVDYLLVSQPSYLTALGKLLNATPVSVWRNYLKWRVISDYAPYLSKPFVDENFAFNGATLSGVPENRPRWKRGLSVVESSIGEGLGKLYVAKHFPAENKARMVELVNNLLEAYRQSINTLDWMSDATKQQAQEKLSKFTVKIGYPKQWRDYSALQIRGDDLVGNVMRAQQFEYRRQLNKLGKPIDRDEWQMTPQTVNAYYNPELNEIVFPAAILQPPFFNVNADEAANYGGIGAVIGHEISHGFDDQGAQYDGDGNLRDWWTQEDHEKFAAKTKSLVTQYAAYEPIKGYHINGELTLGENIADNSGLAIAHRAYLLALAGTSAPVLDGLTGEQRFYAGWAQAWRAKSRDKEAIRLLTIDPHSPPEFRVLGSVVNQDAFYAAFDVKSEDKMYVAPTQRVSIW